MAANRDNRHYLNVPFEEKDEAKAAGAKWDRQAKSWWIAKDADRGPVEKWDKPPLQNNSVTPQQEFGDFIREQGLNLKGEPVMDGNWHRLHLIDQRERKAQAGSYKGYLDGKPNGLVHNFRDGDDKPVKWVATGVSINANDRVALEAEWKAKAAERAVEIEAKQKKAAKKAYGLWANADWAKQETCGYLEEKGLRSHGTRQTKQGGLLVPVRDIEGNLHGVQYITRESKAFTKNSRKHSCMHVIDPGRTIGKGPIIVAEGYATAASIHEATGRPAVVAFDASNLGPVAAALRGRYPSARIVLAADDDHDKQHNAGIEKATKAAEQVGGTVIAVKLTSEQKKARATDFDDLRRLAGPDAVKAQIEDGLQVGHQKAQTPKSVVIAKPQNQPAPKAKAPAKKTAAKTKAEGASKPVVKKRVRKTADKGIAIAR